jgi:hypothetical protein
LEFFAKECLRLIEKINCYAKCGKNNCEEQQKLVKDLLNNLKTFGFLYQEFEKSEITSLDFLVFASLSSCFVPELSKQLKPIKAFAARWKKISSNQNASNQLGYCARHII